MEAMSIRDAQKKDISEMAENLYETESFPQEIWGGENRQQTIKNIKKLIDTKNSRYSLEFTKVVEFKDKLAGLIIMISSNKIRYLNLKTDFKILEFNKGILNKFKFLINLVKF